MGAVRVDQNIKRMENHHNYSRTEQQALAKDEELK